MRWPRRKTPMSTAVAENPKLVLGRELNGIAMTPEEFDAVEEYDDNYSYELIHAGLGRMPDWRHETPTLAVEFVSKGRRNARRDYDEKRRECMAIRIAEYWLIDRFRRILTVFRRAGRKVIEITIKQDETNSTPL